LIALYTSPLSLLIPISFTTQPGRAMLLPTSATLSVLLLSLSGVLAFERRPYPFSPRNPDAHDYTHSILDGPLRLPRTGYGYRVPSAGNAEGSGWLARWLSVGGEGEVNVIVRPSNVQACIRLLYSAKQWHQPHPSSSTIRIPLAPKRNNDTPSQRYTPIIHFPLTSTLSKSPIIP
jgi:hypothetical protein